MRNLIVFYLLLPVLVPIIHVYALPGDAELVLENIGIDPSYPKKGELIAITGDVYNAGLRDTYSFTSIITAAYFVDGKLLYIDEIGNIEPGLSNKIKISSPLIWESETGTHEIKIIIDYHDTLKDQYDSPSDNSLEKTIFIESPKRTEILLEASPQFFIQGNQPKITASLLDVSSNESLDNKKIVLTLNDEHAPLITDEEGKISFSSTFVLSGPINISAYFAGDGKYSSSSSSLMLYSFPKETPSSLIMTITDLNDQYTFEDYPFEILIFQDSYDNLIKKIKSDSAMLLDPQTLWTSLPAGHNYFSEVYLDGKFLFTTYSELLKEDDIMIKELKIPEPGKIRFNVIDEKNNPIRQALIKNWIYSFQLIDGYTDWAYILPSVNEPYIAEVVLSNGSIFKSEPFLLFSGEQKTVHIMLKNVSTYHEIPSWVKNNAGWWAEGSIDDASFIQGIQFLIQEGIMTIPPTTQGESTDTNNIPSWVKNNAGWWAEGSIDDASFIQGIQFLIQEGIIEF